MRQKKHKSDRDGYLKRKFNRTEEEYNEALDRQGGVCFGCGRPKVNVSLHVDHDHKIEQWKISSFKRLDKVWEASPKDGTGRLAFIETGRTKQEARSKVKTRLKRLSVRGVLCWSCNSGLKKVWDNSTTLFNLGTYLNNYSEFMKRNQPYTNGFGE